MPSIIQLAGQAVFYATVALFVGYLSNRPLYHQFPPDKAQIKLSFAHGSKRKEPCRRLTPKEIAELPVRNRRPHNCSRERVPVRVQLILDQRTIYDAWLRPTGIASDGPVRTYRKFPVSPGPHSIVIRMRDRHDKGDFNLETRHEVKLEAGQNLAIDFRSDLGSFIFR